jgi:alkylated DNA repair dioxygenase AlkB
MTVVTSTFGLVNPFGNTALNGQYRADFLGAIDADDLFHRLRSGVAWEQHSVKLFGRTLACPRLSAWYGDPGAEYAYSGHVHHPQRWIAPLAELRGRVEAAAQCSFNSVLLNLYRDGRDSMGWHADDERELGPQPVIASVSLGAPRKLRFRMRSDHATTRELWLGHGSLFVMGAGTQEKWHHALPKTKRVKEARINLTFRQIG